jgi:magnesium chelatase subunit D
LRTRSPDSRSAPPPSRPEKSAGEPPPEPGRAADAAPDRVFAPLDLPAPRLVVQHASQQIGTSSRSSGDTSGGVIGARPTPTPRELDARSSLLHAVTHAGDTRLQADDLYERTRARRSRIRYIFVVDSSGSHGVQERMRLVKGAVAGLLATARGRHDEAVIIACRGAAATVLVEPTTVLADVQRALEYLPTGGRTPLAHALTLAAGYLTDTSIVVLATDGHANVATGSDDARADTLSAARAIRCPSLVIDSERDSEATGRPREVAEAMGAVHVRLSDLDDTSVLHLIQNLDPRHDRTAAD